MLYAELVEHADHDTAYVVAGSVRVRDRVEEQIEGTLVLARVERGECITQIGDGRLCGNRRGSLEADARSQTVRREAAGHAGQHRERLVGLAPALQDPSQGHRRIGAGRLEFVGPTQRLLVAARNQVVRLGGDQRLEELLDGRRGLGTDKLRHDPTLTERLDGRDALDPERPSQTRIGVDVDLDQLDLARTGVRGTLEQRPELPTGAAPAGPEVDHHREGVRPVEDCRLEIRLGDVHDSDGSGAARGGNLTSTSISSQSSAAGDAAMVAATRAYPRAIL